MKYSYSYEYLVYEKNCRQGGEESRMTPKNWIELMDGPKLSYKRLIEKIQQVENVGTWFSIILWKNLKIKLVRPLRNLRKQKFNF